MSHGSSHSSRTLRNPFQKALSAAAYAAIGWAGVIGAAGCHDNTPLVPAGSKLVGAGAGRNIITYPVSQDGTAWVTDEHHHRVVWTGPVHSGDKITVDGDHHAIVLNDATVSQNDVSKSHDYQVYVHP